MRPLCTQFWYSVGQIHERKEEDSVLKIVPRKSSPQKGGYPSIYFQKITVKQYKEPLLAQNHDNHIYCANTVSPPCCPKNTAHPTVQLLQFNKPDNSPGRSRCAERISSKTREVRQAYKWMILFKTLFMSLLGEIHTVLAYSLSTHSTSGISCMLHPNPSSWTFTYSWFYLSSICNVNMDNLNTLPCVWI